MTYVAALIVFTIIVVFVFAVLFIPGYLLREKTVPSQASGAGGGFTSGRNTARGYREGTTASAILSVRS